MKKLQPYRSFDGANRSLDNGGRLWNVFTTAGDRVITKAEIAAAGGGGGWAGALLFFEMMTSRLSHDVFNPKKTLQAPKGLPR